METQLPVATKVPWNKGKLVGQKAPLKLRDIGGIWGQAYASGIWGHVRHVGSGLLLSYFSKISIIT